MKGDYARGRRNIKTWLLLVGEVSVSSLPHRQCKGVVHIYSYSPWRMNEQFTYSFFMVRIAKGKGDTEKAPQDEESLARPKTATSLQSLGPV